MSMTVHLGAVGHLGAAWTPSGWEVNIQYVLRTSSRRPRLFIRHELKRFYYVSLQLLFKALAQLGGAFGAGRLRRRLRFAQQGLASLGLA